MRVLRECARRVVYPGASGDRAAASSFLAPGRTTGSVELTMWGCGEVFPPHRFSAQEMPCRLLSMPSVRCYGGSFLKRLNCCREDEPGACQTPESTRRRLVPARLPAWADRLCR